ncbi:FAD-dependent monooxygenase [Streptomyces sp. FL07-04A]|uniref:FAD-dependent monooxygenase n=1 Tax=Streptomyces sp. FL07-04A TaxID=3028658 RepID=UPI0029B2BA8B|nr:FAD-dependent monooxygenase [Streptomyces sp. FL07-04A]MDX3580032.1 FAD-dependent monooxygenase [Streptomyces sp. FL07-04A]
MSDPVIISGGGPAGLMLAHELGLWGVDTIVLERHTAREGGRSVGQALNTTAAELLDQRGLLDGLREHTAPSQGTHFSLLWLDNSPLQGRHLPALLLGQEYLERELEQQAVKRGAVLLAGRELVGYEQDDAGVTVTVREGGRQSRLRGSYLVGADGEDSRVRELAGIRFPGSSQANCGLVADAEIDFAALEEVHRGARFCPVGGLYSSVPVEPGVTRVITAEFDAELPGPSVAPTARELRASVERLNDRPFPEVAVRWIRRYGGPSRVAERFQDERVFLVGDAAHTFYPLAGLRINLCLQDAVNLGWKLAGDLLGWAAPDLLDTYTAERRPAAVRAASATDTQLALIHPVRRVAPVRELVRELLRFGDVNRYLLELSTGLDVSYAHEDAPGPLGRRLPHVELVTPGGPSSVPRLQHGGRGVLLDLSAGRAAAQAVAAPWSDRVEVAVAQATAEIAAEAVLLRPDGHVAWLGALDDPALTGALRQWFGAGRVRAGRG